MICKLLIGFAIVTLISGFYIPGYDEEQSEIVLLHVIFRHGARTTYSFFATDPNKNQSFYPWGPGGLTNPGKLGEYNLGRYIRSHYNDLIPEIYTDDEVYVRSTDTIRTRMSAQLALAGLFPPKKIQIWNPLLNWQPIPVSYKPADEEDLIHPDNNCPNKIAAYDSLPSIPEVNDHFIKPHKEIYEYVESHSGNATNNPNHLNELYFILRADYDLNYTLPEWTEKIYPEPLNTLGALTYSYHNSLLSTRKINAGYLLKKIVKDTQNKMNGRNEKKVYLYSGHESTIGYMLNALIHQDIAHVPPYSSALLFEIHKKADEYFVKINFRNGTKADEPITYTIPGCDTLCPLNTFIELNQELFPTIPADVACGRRDGYFNYVNY